MAYEPLPPLIGSNVEAVLRPGNGSAYPRAMNLADLLAQTSSTTPAARFQVGSSSPLAVLSNLGATRGGNPGLPSLLDPQLALPPGPTPTSPTYGPPIPMGSSVPTATSVYGPYGPPTPAVTSPGVTMSGSGGPGMLNRFGQLSLREGARYNPLPTPNVTGLAQSRPRLSAVLSRPSLARAGQFGAGVAAYTALDAAQNAAGGEGEYTGFFDTSLGGNQYAEDRLSAAKFGILGGPAGVAGMYLGTAGAQLLPGNEDNEWGNVGENIVNDLFGRYDASGTLDKMMPQLSEAGISASDLARAMAQGEQAGDWIATMLANAGVEGAVRGDDGITLTGSALDLANEMKKIATTDEGGSLGNFIEAMSERELEGEDLDAALAVYQAYLNSPSDPNDPDSKPFSPEQAMQAAIDEVDYAREQQRLATQQQQARAAEMLAFGEQMQRYMAPVTGGMRERADANYAAYESMLAGLNVPPAMAEAMLMQADASRQQQMAMADAYDRQIAIAPATMMNQQARADSQALADQIYQATVMQPAVNQAMVQTGVSSPSAGAGLDIEALMAAASAQ